MPDANYTADAVVLAELLSTAAVPIEVPDWQRSYSWKSDQIEVFWADLIRFDRAHPGTNISNQQYFLGSIVMVNAGSKYLLLDGQQRIATATILLSVLREHRRPLKPDAAQRLQNKYIADFDDATQQTQYSISMNRYDRDFFRKAVQADGQTVAAPKLRSHALIKKAQEYFRAELLSLSSELDDDGSLALNLRLQDVLLKHFSVVSVRSSDEDTASTVFEALNDRGIGLSTPDLLRSYLLRSAPGEVERESIVESWLEIFSLFEEASVETFLRHYWVSLNGDVKTRSLYREIKAHFETNGVDAVTFSHELAEGAADYRALQDSSDANESVKRALEGINQLAATVLYPPLMSALSIRSNIPEGELEGFVRDLLVLHVRYTLIGGRESTKLEAEVFSIAQEIRVVGSLDNARNRVREFAPSLVDFERGFATVSVSRADSAKYLLGELEMDLRATGELVLASGRKVQLEHIYPQSPAPGERLPSHSALVNRIGNHTLLDHRLNASVKNGLFAVKRQSAYGISELHLTQALMLHEVDRWGEAEIVERQKQLAQRAAKVWQFDDSEYQHFVERGQGTSSESVVSSSAEFLPEDDEALVDP